MLDALRGALAPQDALLLVMAVILLRHEADTERGDEWGGLTPAREAWGALMSGGLWRDGGHGLTVALHRGLRAREAEFSSLLDLPNLDGLRGHQVAPLIDWVAAAPDLTEIFEACLDHTQTTSKGGDYYTPSDVARLLAGVMEPREGDAVYDPVCGSGGLLLRAREYLEASGGHADELALYGQDASRIALQTAAMNVSVHGAAAHLGGPESTWVNDRFADRTFDVVVANPPFNQSGWDEGGYLRHSLPWPYGVPPAGNANFAWAQHVVRKMTPTGRGALLLPTGAATTAKAGEGRIRARLVDDDVLSCVVELPAGLIPHVRNPVSLWLFTKSKKPRDNWGRSDRSGQFLLIDARDIAASVTRGRRAMPEAAKKRIIKTFAAWRGAQGSQPYEDVPAWCTSVTRDEIAAKEYDVLPSHHVAAPPAESVPADAHERAADLTDELLGLFETSRRLEGELRDLLGKL
ncbi:SAM-dependent methyltransferase [Streptomyces sp. NBC_00365]|uniref:N-6 DNA methylase n=1 Tax=Streptomyces sp. NBC_00365 TaxID=2975726 RepID=UPI0022588C05|nr:N-6 DNA methylase [Streptomyces sp. NBC_00365]MCX5089884.1 SAM-dependent methyltransferase [Streptomyces sp. NBC_00365]